MAATIWLFSVESPPRVISILLAEYEKARVLTPFVPML